MTRTATVLSREDYGDVDTRDAEDLPQPWRPHFEPLPGGGYVYALDDQGIRVELRYLRREHGHLYGEADVRCTWAGASRHNSSLSCADLNLSSQTARKTLAKYCADRAHTKPEDFDWMGVIDAACLETIGAERRGADVIVLDDAEEVPERDVDVCGLSVPADATSMLIAHGDSLKSMMLLLVLGSLAQRGHAVLYADWEWSAPRHKTRKQRLFGSQRLDGLRYLRCRAPLTVEVDRVRRYCDQHGVGFVGIDSVGLACDGKLSDDDVAIRFHRALASLPPSLCAAHVPKSSLTPEASKRDPIGPFGSVFFSNLCRMSWVLKKQPGATDDLVTVGCFPQKQNDGARRRPVGLEFDFTGDRIGVRTVDLASVDGLAQRLPLAARMTAVLKRGPRSFAELAEELDAKVDSVIKAANRSKAFTRVSSPDGVSRLALVERHVA
jgi:hypothetical protein